MRTHTHAHTYIQLSTFTTINIACASIFTSVSPTQTRFAWLLPVSPHIFTRGCARGSKLSVITSLPDKHVSPLEVYSLSIYDFPYLFLILDSSRNRAIQH